jgi:glycosyltransferase involved in cell wall biosynthesis
LPVLEAMACGLPVITSICAGVSGMIGDGIDGFVLSDPSDAVSLARLLREIYADADLRSRVAGAAAQAAHQWTWDRNAEGVWQLLQDTAKRNRVIGQAAAGS